MNITQSIQSRSRLYHLISELADQPWNLFLIRICKTQISQINFGTPSSFNTKSRIGDFSVASLSPKWISDISGRSIVNPTHSVQEIPMEAPEPSQTATNTSAALQKAKVQEANTTRKALGSNKTTLLPTRSRGWHHQLVIAPQWLQRAPR